MNVQFINPFLEGTVEILKAMAIVEPAIIHVLGGRGIIIPFHEGNDAF